MSGIKAIVTDHFKMFIRDMADKTCTKIQNRNGFVNKNIIFMAIVMEGDKVPIIMVNTFCGNNRSSEISADILSDNGWITTLIFGINIETMFVKFVHGRFHFFKRRTKKGSHFI